MTGHATAARPARPHGPTLKFPCGHIEPEQAVARRSRSSATAMWVRCLKCNVIALVVERTQEARPVHPSA
jgi:hypothetical protein